jgi:23S rRNA pseudouridine2604 synthase
MGQLVPLQPGRLDKDSTGLILLTSDGRLPNAVLRSGHCHDKKYVVTVDREVRAADVVLLRAGVVISTPVQRDRVSRIVTARTLPCRVDQVGRCTLEMVLQEGRNRQIRRMLDHVGYEVTALHRVEVMGLDLSGLRRGEWKACSPAEMDVIRKCLHAPGAGGDDEEEEEDFGED